MKSISLEQFRKVPVHHILFALVFAGCFGAAYHFSRHVDFAPENKSNNTDTDTDAAEEKNVDHGPPYCIFGAVAGGVVSFEEHDADGRKGTYAIYEQ